MERLYRSMRCAALAMLVAGCAHRHAAEPSAVPRCEAAGRVTSGAVSPEERRLYDIVLQLAKDPDAQPRLAPAARVIFHGDEEVDRPLENPNQELAWIAGAALVPSTAPPVDSDETIVRCVAADLRCIVEQPGGETILSFAPYGAGGGRRVVLRAIESFEP